MNSAPLTPKGFRDLLPEIASRKRETIAKIEAVLEQFGFIPIETPTIEFAETLTGKYGEEEKLIYQFEDRGGRKLALRYDLTVPLARYVATYNPKLPFRRYQVGQVFRGENPQKGRFREFTQFDFDSVGSADPEEDAKIIAAAIKSAKEIGLNTAVMLINDRQNFTGIPIEVIRAVDKVAKVGWDGVKKEIIDGGLSESDCDKYIDQIKNSKPTSNLEQIFNILKEKYSLQEETNFKFDPTLARGLDYYTGAIFELKGGSDPTDLSIGAGGRYDNLIGTFTRSTGSTDSTSSLQAGSPQASSGQADIPAVGFSFGLDRLLEIIYP